MTTEQNPLNLLRNQITAIDIDTARIDLESGCDAIASITNAVEVLSSIEPRPDNLFGDTIAKLMSHATYLASSMKNDVGCFIDKVEV